MLKRMWRAFWVAMREPVSKYAPHSTMTLRVDVDIDDAMRKLEALVARADGLRQATEIIQ
jgi:hypothetical protein